MRREFRFAISAGAMLVLTVFAVTPRSVWPSMPVVCVFRNTLGLECLGCGMTRALSHAMHGDIQSALAANTGVAAVLPALIGAAFWGLRR
jgi:hypothetical protein